MKNSLLYVFILFISFYSNAQKILFDATKAETAGCADWIIDADLYNLNWGPNPYLNTNNWRSNAQRIPSPPQSGINSTTTEDYWTGGISNWAVDCAKKGYTVETLPYTGKITYNDNTNAQDLKNYKVYIVTEPNILFTAAEKTAIMQFVKNGGGLFMVSDHDVSDRNNDTYDSPHIWNDLISNNTIQNYPFGIIFDYQNFSQTSNSASLVSADTNLINGSMGKVAKVQWSNGTSMTIDPTANNTVKSVVFKNGTTSGNSNVLVAYATFGSGRVVAIGDSSPCDDGTGNPNAAANTCTLYNGYINDAGVGSGNHQKLLMNATIWLATNPLSTENNKLNNFNFSIVPNPIKNKELKINYTLTENEPITVAVFDALGRAIKTETYSNSEIGFNSKSISLDNLNAGVYFCKIFNTNISNSLPFIIN
jgi:hypothetical protein